MEKICVVLSGAVISLFIMNSQSVFAEGFENQAMKVRQEICSLQGQAKEVEEKIKAKLDAQAPAVEIKELEQKGAGLRLQIDALNKELIGLDKARSETEQALAKEEMNYKLDLNAGEINLKLDGLRDELLKLDNAYSQEIAQGVPAKDLEGAQIRMKQIKEELKFLQNELEEISRNR